MKKFKNSAIEIQEFLDLKRRFVGIKIFNSYNSSIYGFEVDNKLRYCEVVLTASKGTRIAISKENLSCPSSVIAIGFENPKYTELEPRIKPAETEYILLGPLDEWNFDENPDLVISICNPKQAMQIASALGGIDIKARGEIAFCGELTATTFMSGKPSISLLCMGGRVYGGFNNNEMGVSFTLEDLERIADNFKRLEKIEGISKKDLKYVNLTPSSKLILQVLDEAGRCSQQDLTEYTKLSERSVRNSIKQLKSREMISEIPDRSDKRKKEYRLR